MKKIISFTLVLLTALTIYASSTDTLITIDNNVISSEEFLRVYNKNNSITSATDKKDIEEYMDLFINYKLKVIEAEHLGYDTIDAFKKEYNGYKKQLAKPYLEPVEYKEDLVKEAYSRYLEEIRASHILIKAGANDYPKDTLKAFRKISEIRARVVAGEPFEEVAKATSDDPSVKHNGGDLGYFTVFSMVYPFESAAYNTKTGEISEIVRTSYGYHIIKVNDRRVSKGQIKVSHIMTRIKKNATKPEINAAEEKIDKAYLALMNGTSWEDAVEEFSENPRTAKKAGDLGWLKSGQAPDEFLTPCYALNIGEFTKPIKTEGGYHIGYVTDKKDIESFEEAEEMLNRKIERDGSRKERLTDIRIANLKEKYNFEAYQDNIDELAKAMAVDSSLYKKEWKASSVENMVKPVIKIDSTIFTQYQFGRYLESKSILSNSSVEDFITYFLPTYISLRLNQYAKEMLPVEHPEYKYLLQEYHDGILLFNLTNDVVWDKAQTDTLGLEAFYKKANKYQWNERIDVTIYKYSNSSYTSELPGLIKKQRKKKYEDSFLSQNLCPNDTVPCIEISQKSYEKGQDAMADKLEWSNGSYIVESDNDWNYIYYVVKTHGKEDKKLNEARGLYMADYQNYLEESWVNELRTKYVIEINQDLFDTLKE